MRPRLAAARKNEPLVFVMVKEPRPGKVKTRLGKDIGMLAAAQWYKRHAARLCHRLVDARWSLVAAYDPKMSRIIPNNTQLQVWQGTGDLGRRMIRMLRLAPAKSILIGSDILGLEKHHIARAVAALGTYDAVLGPSPDGGYWLIGFRHPERIPLGLLDGVRWSSEHAMADTLARLPGRVALAEQLNDADTIDDLR